MEIKTRKTEASSAICSKIYSIYTIKILSDGYLEFISLHYYYTMNEQMNANPWSPSMTKTACAAWIWLGNLGNNCKRSVLSIHREKKVNSVANISTNKIISSVHVEKCYRLSLVRIQGIKTKGKVVLLLTKL